jgi:hypothetical protein
VLPGAIDFRPRLDAVKVPPSAAAVLATVAVHDYGDPAGTSFLVCSKNLLPCRTISII